MEKLRQLLAAAAASIALMLCTASVQAQVPTYQFDLPAQPLAQALRAVGRQTSKNVLFDPALVEGINAPALRARLTLDDALSRLLAGTKLSVQSIEPDTMLIEGARASGPDTSSGVRLMELDEVVVTGTHIRGVAEIAAPTLVFTRQHIETTGYAGLDSLFEGLPQNFDAISFDATFGERIVGGGSNRADRASGANLRGLGPGSTLTLLNGLRRAGSVNGTVVDLSTIPLSAIERVEIVTGGRSAIYGSDAVGGVVNLVTRRQFSGLETQVQYGWASKGGDQLQASVVTGGEFGRGGLIVAYDYQRDWSLDLLDTGLFNSPIPVSGIVMRENFIRPDAWRHSGLVAGRFALTDRIELSADGLYTSRDHHSWVRQVFPGAVNESYQFDDTASDTFSLSAGARIDFGAARELRISAAASEVERRFRGRQHFDQGFVVIHRENNVDDLSTRMQSVSAVFNTPLPVVAGIQPKLALGIEARTEDMRALQSFDGPVVSVLRDLDIDRQVTSVFGELLVPLVHDGTRAGLESLQLSLSGRYDDYDDFGDTFNPEAGVIWRPGAGLTLRGSYSEAFRAPALVELGSDSMAVLQNFSDPTRGSALTPVLVWGGDNQALKPETARTWTFSIDYRPPFAPFLGVSLSYFDIEYRDRIASAAGGADFPLVLQREGRYVGLIDRAPDPAAVAAILASDSDGLIANATGIPFNPATQDIFTVFPALITFDNRNNNLSVETVRGLDMQLDADFDTAIGALRFGINGSYTLDHERRVTATSPVFMLLNETGMPVDLRLRANAGWRRGAYGAYVYLNYVDGYSNPLVTPADAMPSWTTVDLTLRFDGTVMSDAGWLHGMSVTLSAENVLDRDPPTLLGGSAGGGYRYDAANASALGRYLSVRFKKEW